ncbi:hypothetical protein ACIBH1_38250 [Nonomuraea sp. NPDC050663]|uniref:hypothetical protein n=1 Tax=Nonomuraea sp. NPDC050663 TaxID=3364370 RepID=UPI003794104F
MTHDGTSEGGSWLSPQVEVRPSPIEGFGLFAASALPSGTVVMRLGGQEIDDAGLAALVPPRRGVRVREPVVQGEGHGSGLAAAGAAGGLR